MCEKLVYIHGLHLYTYMYVFDGGGMIKTALLQN